MATAPELPGRLGKPDMTLGDDPRADRRLIAAMEPLGLLAPQPALPVKATSPVEALLEYVTTAEEGFEGLYAMMSGAMAPDRGRDAERRGDPRRRRQRHHALRPPPRRRRTGRCRACSTCTAAAWSLLEAAGAGYAALARRARRHRASWWSASSSATAAASTGRTRSRPGSTTARPRCSGCTRARTSSASASSSCRASPAAAT